MRIRAIILLIILLNCQGYLVFADEGFWLPIMINEVLENRMRKLGMEMQPDELYHPEQPSLKDAVVRMGGCTASVISPRGLLMTNYHCSYHAINRHSSDSSDLIEEGFWAKDESRELPARGLEVQFLQEIRKVTNEVLDDIPDTLSAANRFLKIQENIFQIELRATEGTELVAEIKPFYQGNEYYLFTYQTYTDVRIVGAPPNSIGRFGGDTDNWMWPRHTGDFCLLRIYADKDGKPARYSENNVPLKTETFLPISLADKQENDFTLVYGFPGMTNHYLSSFHLQNRIDYYNRTRISFLRRKIRLFEHMMQNSQAIKSKYQATYSGLVNFYKKYLGQNQGLTRCDAITKRQMVEQKFANWSVDSNEAINSDLIEQLKLNADQAVKPKIAQILLKEGLWQIELMQFAQRLNVHLMMLESTQGKFNKKYFQDYYKSIYTNDDPALRQQLFEQVIAQYFEQVSSDYVPEILKDLFKQHDGNISELTTELFANSIISSEEKWIQWFSKKEPNWKLLLKDPLVVLSREFDVIENVRISPLLAMVELESMELNKKFFSGLQKMLPDSNFYANANHTLRFSYGSIQSSNPEDGMKYLPFTTLHGVMAKEDTIDPEFQVPEKLKQLAEGKEFGRYAQNDSLIVNFLANNHTAGGNSGSPVIDAQGALIGLNFDRTLQSNMSDLMYDPKICRNISVDIRYILFIIDKFANADYLLEEMEILSSDVSTAPAAEY